MSPSSVPIRGGEGDTVPKEQSSKRVFQTVAATPKRIKDRQRIGTARF